MDLKISRSLFLGFISALLFVPTTLQAQSPSDDQAENERVIHQLSFPQTNLQQVKVTSRIPSSADQMVLIMPSWIPGSYLIRDYARHIAGIRVSNPSGGQLPAEKVAKNRWLVNTNGASHIVVEYDVFAGDLSVRSSWVSPEFALINGATLFMYTAQSRSLEQQVDVVMPPGWQRGYAAMRTLQSHRSWLAADYDELVDSPMLLGNPAAYTFRSGQQAYSLVNVGETMLWDADQAVDDVHKIVKVIEDFWEVVPFDREYYFLNLLVEARGGLEHDNSTVLMTSRGQMRDREEYIKWLSLVAHEFFHAWNVRRLRPQELKQYDYENEQYLHVLWMAEGITNYYDNLFLIRAGLINVDEYFKRLAEEFYKVESHPGRHVRSVETASFDAWIKYYRPDSNSVNSSVSYYNKGAMIGFVLDQRIRAKTRNRKSLDDVMRAMYERYHQSGYSRGAFEAMVAELVDRETADWLQDVLRTTQEPGVDSALAWYGLLLDRNPARTTLINKGRMPGADMGVLFDEEKKTTVIKEVLHGSPAASAGLLAGDELLAVNGERVSYFSYPDLMLRMRAGETVSVHYARHKRLAEVQLTLGEMVSTEFQILASENLSPRHQRNLRSWLVNIPEADSSEASNRFRGR